MKFGTKNYIVILYFLAGLVLIFSISTFLYQYIAAVGSFSAVLGAFGNSRILTALGLSLLSAFATAALAIIFGVPLAYVLTMKEFKGKLLVETLAVDVPQTFPPIAEGMIFLLMLGPNSPLHVNLASTFTALVIAKFFISAPFVVSFTTRRFREIKQTGMNLTARSLGANPFLVFTTIFIPLSFKDIGAGVSLCWSRAMGELGGSLLFASVIPYQTEIIPTFIATQAKTLTIEALAATILVTTASTLAIISFKKLT
ncbi:ABC transporter permease subunit [Candidatus Gottesmanbacteria bacterium]|nr:ABC transporter permease subunit [Candidatus Gottesmanbacteria bacterium]